MTRKLADLMRGRRTFLTVKAFLEAINWCVSSLEHPPSMSQGLMEFGKLHAKMGVNASDYANFNEAFCWSMKLVLDKWWNDRTRSAWQWFLMGITETMQTGVAQQNVKGGARGQQYISSRELELMTTVKNLTKENDLLRWQVNALSSALSQFQASTGHQLINLEAYNLQAHRLQAQNLQAGYLQAHYFQTQAQNYQLGPQPIPPCYLSTQTCHQNYDAIRPTTVPLTQNGDNNFIKHPSFSPRNPNASFAPPNPNASFAKQHEQMAKSIALSQEMLAQQYQRLQQRQTFRTPGIYHNGPPQQHAGQTPGEMYSKEGQPPQMPHQ